MTGNFSDHTPLGRGFRKFGHAKRGRFEKVRRSPAALCFTLPQLQNSSPPRAIMKKKACGRSLKNPSPPRD